MDLKKYSNEIQEFKETYPDENSGVITSDGQIFKVDAQRWAEDHAKRNGLEFTIFDVEESKKDTKSSGKKSEGKDDFSDLNLQDKTIKELKAFAEENEIEVKATKKDDIINEITEALNNPLDLNEGEGGSEDGDDYEPVKTES